jgi:hypothetical protein
MRLSRFGELAEYLVGKSVRVECSDAKGLEWVYKGTVIGCHPEALTLDLGSDQPIHVVTWHSIETVKVSNDGS